MTHEVLAGNPFMLMTNPEVVIAAMERSERLGQLNSRLCRPLDRPMGLVGQPSVLEDDDSDMLDDADNATNAANAIVIDAA